MTARVGWRFHAPLAVAVVAVFAGAGVSFWAFRQIEESGAARARTFVVIDAANELLSELRDAETGERGYMLTGETVYLEPYKAVRAGMGAHLKALRLLTTDDAALGRLDALAPLIASESAELARAIELRRRHDVSAALLIIRSRRAKRLMDGIRSEMGAFVRIEESVLAQRDERFQSNLRRLFIVLEFTSLIALVLSLAFVGSVRREAELSAANSKAAELNKFKSDLVGVVSHEVANALSVMKLATVLLEEKLPPEWLKEGDRLFDMIRTNIDALNRAVQNLLNMGRLEAGKLAIRFEPTDAAEMLRSVHKCMELLCENKRLSVALELPDGLRPVRADHASLTLVVSNLLSNAIKYTPPGGCIVLGAVEEAAHPGRCRIFVQDTGIGVSEEDRARILDGHFRAESGKKMTTKGFGVGLSLAQSIVEAHGSGIEIEGAPGQGSRFSFLLPVS